MEDKAQAGEGSRCPSIWSLSAYRREGSKSRSSDRSGREPLAGGAGGGLPFFLPILISVFIRSNHSRRSDARRQGCATKLGADEHARHSLDRARGHGVRRRPCTQLTAPYLPSNPPCSCRHTVRLSQNPSSSHLGTTVWVRCCALLTQAHSLLSFLLNGRMLRLCSQSISKK